MSRKVSTERGFSAIEVLIVLVVIAAIGFGGWLVWHNHTKKAATTTSSSTTQKKQQPSGTRATDPYAGWKTYCDDNAALCFRYPANWTLIANSDQVTILNATKNVEIDYITPYVHDSGLVRFLPVSVSELATAGTGLKVVGGIYLPANEPDYGVVDGTLLGTYTVTLGQQTNFPNALRFSDTKSATKHDVAFRARSTDPEATQAEAQAWYEGADAKTALQILQSLYYK